MSSKFTFGAMILTAPPPGLAGESAAVMLKIDGREALLRSVELFLNRPEIKQIQLVITPESEEEIKRKFGGNLGFMGVKVVVGGKKWQEQIAAAATKLAAEITRVIVHDVSRPIVAIADIDALLAAGDHPAVALTAPVRSPILELDEGGAAVAIHPAAGLAQLLTPQVYSRQRLTELAGGREVHPSEFKLVKGSILNMRVGGPVDSGLAKAMLNQLPKPKIKAPDNPFEEAQW
jgi:2-C-methyl-D-erythritol 4-phosphate cytidylyltransferase